MKNKAIIAEEDDVDVIDRDHLDMEFQVNFKHRWIVQWPNGFSLSFRTEKKACRVQEEWRAAEEKASASYYQSIGSRN